MRETVSLFILSILMKLDSDKIVFVDAINTKLFRLLTGAHPYPPSCLFTTFVNVETLIATNAIVSC